MLNKKNYAALKSFSFSLLVFQCLSANASDNHGELDGFYVTKKGWVESQELRPGDPIAGEQLGRFKVVLKRKGWDLLEAPEKDRIRKKLVISGIFHGLVQDPFGSPIIEHKLSNLSRDGVLYTLNDTVSIKPGEPCTFSIQETLNIERGAGIYQDLQPGGIVTLKGIINYCTSQNDFEVVPNKGGLCFGVCE